MGETCGGAQVQLSISLQMLVYLVDCSSTTSRLEYAVFPLFDGGTRAFISIDQTHYL